MQILIALILFLSLLCIFEFKVNNNDFCCPPVLFLAPFVAASFIALLYSNEWFFSMHINTFIVIAVGSLSMCIGDFVAKKIKIKNKNKRITDLNNRIENWKLILFLIFSTVCYIWKLKCIKQFGAANGYHTLPEAISYLNYLAKFTTEAYIKYPPILSANLQIITASGFVWACILAQSITNKEKNKPYIFLLMLNFIICIIGSMTSGGRGGAVQLLVAFICIYLLAYKNANNNRKKIPFKVKIRVLILFCIIIYGFVAVMNLLGRKEIHMIGKYLANYIGAEIYNLDHFLNNSFKRSVIFGQESFQPIVQYLAKIFNNPSWSNYNLDLPFVYINSKSLGIINLGNVYTTYYAYIHDFGYLGVIILPFIIGFISRVFYRAIKNNKGDKKVNIRLLIYSNIAYALTFSYFSNKFFELIIAPAMIRKIICFYLILFCLYKIRIKKYKSINNEEYNGSIIKSG